MEIRDAKTTDMIDYWIYIELYQRIENGNAW